MLLTSINQRRYRGRAKMLRRVMDKLQMAVLVSFVMAAAQDSVTYVVKERGNWTRCYDGVKQTFNTMMDLPAVSKSQQMSFLQHILNVSDITYNMTPNLPQELQEEVKDKTTGMLCRVEQGIKSLKHYYASHNTDYDSLELVHLELLLKKKSEFLKELQNFTEEIIHLKNSTDYDNITESTWLTVKTYANTFKMEIEYMEQDRQADILLRSYVQPVLHGIIFIIGSLGNGVLIAISIKHRQMWTSTNIMLLNLAIGDIFSLVVNLPLFYIYSTTTTWVLGEFMCKLFRFTRHLGIGVSVFSVVALSIQRYCATVQSSRGKQLKRRLSKFLVVCVWVTACFFAIPQTILAGVYEKKCYNLDINFEYYIPAITLFEFLVVCLLPIVTIMILTILTVCRLSLTINNTAKEGRRAIGRVTKILAVLTTVFAGSYVPFYLYRLLYVWHGLQLSTMTHRVLQVVLYTLLFSNACFNPVALYSVSHTFRYYFHKYLFPCCRQLEDNYSTDLTSYAEDVSQTSPE